MTGNSKKRKFLKYYRSGTYREIYTNMTKETCHVYYRIDLEPLLFFYKIRGA